MADGAALKGAKEYVKNLRKQQNKIPDDLARAMYTEAQVELTEMKRRTPVRFGVLRATLIVLGPFVGAGLGFVKRVLSIIYSAGGPAAPYAVYVHENEDAFHKVGESKFMESVWLESKAYFAARVARRAQFSKP